MSAIDDDDANGDVDWDAALAMLDQVERSAGSSAAPVPERSTSHSRSRPRSRSRSRSPPPTSAWRSARYRGKRVWCRMDGDAMYVDDRELARIRYCNDSTAKVYTPTSADVTILQKSAAKKARISRRPRPRSRSPDPPDSQSDDEDSDEKTDMRHAIAASLSDDRDEDCLPRKPAPKRGELVNRLQLRGVTPASSVDMQCVACMTNRKNVANEGCGHIALCLECVPSATVLTSCPVCRAPVTHWMTVQ